MALALGRSLQLRLLRRAAPGLIAGSLLVLLASAWTSPSQPALRAPDAAVEPPPPTAAACDCSSEVADAVVALLQSPSAQSTAAPTCAPPPPPPPPAAAPVSAADAVRALRSALEALPASRTGAAPPLPSDGTVHDARVAAAFDEYVARHARIMAPGGDAAEKRFLAWNVRTLGGTGLGNRILGAMSTLALAIATDRAFLLGPDDILGPLLRPAAGGINWDYGAGVAAYRAAHGGAEPGVRHLLHGMEILDWTGCDDLRVTHAGDPILTLESSQYFYPEVSHNPHYREKLRAILGDGFSFFRHAMRRFVALAPEVASALDDAEARMFFAPPAGAGGARRRRHVIGMQIRVGHLVRADHEEQVFYRCAAALAAAAREQQPREPAAALTARGGGSDGGPHAAAMAALAEVERALTAAAVAGGAAAGRAADAGGSDVSPDVYYFLATDNDGVRARARAVFGDRLLTYSGHGPAAIIDTFLLSRCDDTIITWSRSTFGSVGAALNRNGLPAHAVMSGAKRGAECVRLMSTEPCFHAWFDRWKLSCYNKPGFETPETLNMENCYHCQADTGRCPATDAADRFMRFTSPLDYEALIEIGPSKYELPSTTSAEALAAQYAPAYAAWHARAGAAPHPFTERNAAAAEAASRAASAAAVARGEDLKAPFERKA